MTEFLTISCMVAYMGGKVYDNVLMYHSNSQLTS